MAQRSGVLAEWEGPKRPVNPSLRVSAANVRCNLTRDSDVEPGRVVGAADCVAALIVVRLRRRGLVAARGTSLHALRPHDVELPA